MIPFLVYTGLVFIPIVLCQGYEPRAIKEIFSLLIAVAISLASFYHGSFKKIKNYWILYLLFFMFAGLFFSPNFNMAIGAVKDGNMFVSDMAELQNIWNYKPILYAFVYFLMFMSICSSEININVAMKCIAWTSFFISVYCILQRFGFEQFLIVKPYKVIGSVDVPGIVGTIGQPTLCAAFLAMCFPAVIFCKKWLFAPILLLAIYFCKSDIASGAVLSGIIILLFSKTAKSLKITFLVLFLLFILLISTYHFQDSGRFSIWNLMLEDIKMQRHAITGSGAGAFHYIFSSFYKNSWFQAHNEYLEFFYNYGALGLILLLMAIGSIYKYILEKLSIRPIKYLGSMFLIVCLCAGGTFPWQLGVTTFYTVTILGLIYNIGEQNVAIS